eukprot:gb/GFBE01067662.1/.p1 GENE.gb/GFBE01067662.1/~~gb/GFBE01067662.1/.p1  ORF type:complete len:222 (+),score=68.08 gb/GFBE01067662.1/:1-666(+)
MGHSGSTAGSKAPLVKEAAPEAARAKSAAGAKATAAAHLKLAAVTFECTGTVLALLIVSHYVHKIYESYHGSSDDRAARHAHEEHIAALRLESERQADMNQHERDMTDKQIRMKQLEIEQMKLQNKELYMFEKTLEKEENIETQRLKYNQELQLKKIEVYEKAMASSWFGGNKQALQMLMDQDKNCQESNGCDSSGASSSAPCDETPAASARDAHEPREVS